MNEDVGISTLSVSLPAREVAGQSLNLFDGTAQESSPCPSPTLSAF